MDPLKTLSNMNPIIIMLNLIKLEIFEKNEDFNIAFNNFRNKYFYHREDRINEILGEKIEIGKNKIIFGEPYVEKYLNMINLKKVSHSIEFLSIENGRYYGYIKLLDIHDGIDFMKFENNLILRPVYLPLFDDIEIITFNIDFDRKEIYKQIIDRK